MTAAVKPGGQVVVLDYNHQLNEWSPEPPREFRRFWRAFLDWRGAYGWDNLMGDHLPALFDAAGLSRVTSTVDDEASYRGEPASAIWLQVIETLGAKCMPDETERRHVEETYREYVTGRLDVQRLSLRTVVGVA